MSGRFNEEHSTKQSCDRAHMFTIMCVERKDEALFPTVTVEGRSSLSHSESDSRVLRSEVGKQSSFFGIGTHQPASSHCGAVSPGATALSRSAANLIFVSHAHSHRAVAVHARILGVVCAVQPRDLVIAIVLVTVDDGY